MWLGDNTMHKFVDFIVGALTLALLALILAIVLVNWSLGCGEVFVYADGTHHVGECIKFGGFFK